MKCSVNVGLLVLAVVCLAFAFTLAEAPDDGCSADSINDFWYGDVHYVRSGTTYKVTECNPGVTDVDLTDVEYEGTHCDISSISANAFANAQSTLYSITISSTVEEIGNNAFYGCTALNFVTIASDNHLEDIGSYAFYGCTSLTQFIAATVNTPQANALAIGEKAFCGCSSLTDVAFKYSYDLDSSGGQFFGCSSLETFTVVDNGHTTPDVGPIYMNSNKVSLSCFPAKMKIDGEYVTRYILNTNLGMILDRAFDGTQYLEELTIPGGVSSIVMYDSVNNTNGAFTECMSLKKIIVDDSGYLSTTYKTENGILYDYDKYIIYRCPAAISLGTSGDLSMTDSVRTISPYAFYGCSTLRYVNFASYSKIETIGDCAFKNSAITSFSLATIPGSDSVTMGKAVFEGCEALRTFNSSHLESLSDDMFNGCVLLNSVTLTNTLLTIGDRTFNDCCALETVTLPTSVTTIGECVFEGCSSLRDISIDESGGTSADFECLNGVLYTFGLEKLIKYPMAKSDLAIYTVTDDTVDGIEDYAFKGNKYLISVTIPSGWTSDKIGTEAFYGCTALTEVVNNSYPAITVVAGSDDYGCIGKYADSRFVRNGTSTTPETSTAYMATLADTGSCCFISDFDGISTKHILYRYMISAQTAITFPTSYTYQAPDETTVTVSSYIIGRNSFTDTVFTKITLSSGIESIEQGAFNSCLSLGEVDLGSYVGYIDNRRFTDCPSLSVLTADNTAYKSNNNGVLLNSDETILMMYPVAKTDAQYIIPVSTVSEYAFCYNPYITSITGNKLTMIGEYAFLGCTGFSVLYVRENVDVCDNAFEGCTGITSVEVASGSIIEDEVFNGCTSLETVLIHQGVLSIGDSAFKDCVGLKTVTIEATGSSLLGNDVFHGCTAIESITMPMGLDACSFANEPSTITSLKELTFAADTSCYEYTELTVKNTPWYQSNSSEIDVVFSDGITSVTGHLFHGCTGIVSVILPDTVVSVGDNVFVGCSNLTAMSLPVTLDASTMGSCTTLTEITFTKGSGTVGHGHDYTSTESKNTPWHNTACTDVTMSFASEITYIGDYMFSEYKGTETFAMPAQITEVGSHAFESAEFKHVTFSSGSSLTVIGEYAFGNCVYLEGHLAIPNGVVTIKDHAFASDSGLTSITIPTSVIDDANFGTGILDGCTKLQTLMMPVTLDSTDLIEKTSNIVRSITLTVGTDTSGQSTGVSRNYTQSEAENTIWSASNANQLNLVLGNGVESVGNYMFYSCGTLVSLTVLGNTVTQIGNHAFEDCVQFVDFGSMLNNVSIIGDYAFAGCVKLNTLRVSDSIVTIGTGAFSGCTGIKNLSIPIVINATPFNDCNNLSKVTFTAGNGENKGIGIDYDRSTYRSLPWYRSGSEFIELTISDGVKHIGSYCLYSCDAIEILTIPSSVESIGEYAFYGCSSINGTPNLSGVTSIGDYAFCGCNNITSISLPEKIQTVGECAFNECYAADLLEFPVYIDGSVFFGCLRGAETVKSVNILCGGKSGSSGIGYDYELSDTYTLPWTSASNLNVTLSDGIIHIGANMFRNCLSLTDLTIPSSVTTIGDYAFSGCNQLVDMTFTAGTYDSLTIGDYALSGIGLSSITLDDRITELGDYALANSVSLAEITINETSTLRTVGRGAFSGCPIETIYIPVGVTEIPAYAFDNTGLSTINFADLSKLQKIGDYAFNGVLISTFTIPDSIQELGTKIFNGCIQLREMTIPVDRDLTCLNGTYSITKITFTSGTSGICYDYGVGDFLNYKDLPWNNRYASSGLEVIFGHGVTHIGNNLFNCCNVLTSVSYYEKDGVSDIRTIGNYSFKGCVGLNTITLPSGLVSIGKDAFADCVYVSDINISDTVTDLNDVPFKGCTSVITYVVDSDNQYYSVRGGALCNADGDTLIRYPSGVSGEVAVYEGVTAIETMAFEGCSGIRTIDFNEVSTIRSYAFTDCSSIESLEFGEGVTYIGEYAFSGCSSVTSMTFMGRDITINAMSFALGTESKPVTCSVRAVVIMDLEYYSDGNTTFVYEDVPCAITFAYNGGSTVVSCKKGETITLPSNPDDYEASPYKYKFVKWKDYTDGMVATGDMTFTALYDVEYTGYVSPTQKDKVIMIVPVNANTITISESVLKQMKLDAWEGLIGELQIELYNGSMVIDQLSLSSLTAEEVTISIESISKDLLPKAIANVVGDRPVYYVKFGYINEFSGSVTVTIPYTLKEDESAYSMKVWCLSEDGKYTSLECACIDDTIAFITQNLSYFAFMQVEEHGGGGSGGGGGGDTPTPSTDDNSTPWYVYVGIIAAVLILAIIAILVWRRRH